MFFNYELNRQGENVQKYYINYYPRRTKLVNFIVRNYFFLFVCALFSTWTEARISEEKCREYADYAHAYEMSPVLRMGVQLNLVSQCGIIETPLIIGGTKAKPKEFPHMVVIGYGHPRGNKLSWSCGGSLISEDFILTAAHCLKNSYSPAIRVRAGSVKINDPYSDYQERNIVERIKYPDYKLPRRYHDIALIKVDEPFEMNSFVRPACLETGFMLYGKKYIATGFGKTSFDSNVGNNDLMKVSLNYIPKRECEKAYNVEKGGRQMPFGLIPNMMCAGVMEGGKDTCQGDSGGPLQRVLEEPYCMYSIVGVTSFGKFCGFENSPAIYTKVNRYLDWIESIVWPDG